MLNPEKKMRKFIQAVRRKLNMPKDVKERVMNDLISSIQGRREAGQTDEEIYAELGTAARAAADLNEQMKEYTYTKSPWRWACLALVIFCCGSLLITGILLLLSVQSQTSSIGIIGGADGPTAIFVTTSPDYFIYEIGCTLLLLVMGVLGYHRLRRIPRK